MSLHMINDIHETNIGHYKQYILLMIIAVCAFEKTNMLDIKIENVKI